MNKIALITGITGQTGSYLAELLLDKNYTVHGIIRRSSSFNTKRIDHLYNNPNLILHYGDMSDSLSIDNIVHKTQPGEIYNLGAQSHVAVSFELPEYTGQVDGLGILRLLEAARKHCPNAKIYQASTSELFGDVLEIPQTEKTPFNPKSPYGSAKLYAYYICKNYRESYNMFICNGILFNHESPRRGDTFVTKKIIKGLVNWKHTKTPIKLGNIFTKRDWGYAPEYVYGMWLMLQQEKPDDYILATGETHTIKEFIEEACEHLDIKLTWWNNGEGIDEKTGLSVIKIDKKYFRPNEVNLLIGDYSKARKLLNWEPKTKFKDLIKIMIEHELKNETN